MPIRPYPPRLVVALEARLRRGEHLALFGPRGSGKSAVLAQLQSRLTRAGIPCALSATTRCLDDVTRVLADAYPGVDTRNVTRRTARARLWRAADGNRGVLLLDDLGPLSNAMVTFLRRLHGGVAGMLAAVDVDDERERQRMKPWRYGALSVRMPPASTPRLRRLLHSRCAALRLPRPDPRMEHALLRAARGRPGWIVKCTELERNPRYWHDQRLFLSVLCTDTEAAVRHRALEMLRPGEAGRRDSRALPGVTWPLEE